MDRQRLAALAPLLCSPACTGQRWACPQYESPPLVAAFLTLARGGQPWKSICAYILCTALCCCLLQSSRPWGLL